MKNKISSRAFLLSATGLTIISIIMGLLVGAVILLVAGYNPLQAYSVILKGIFSKPKYMSYTIIKATPLIITGLSIAFAYKTGLFNIGAEGQFIMGGLAAALTGYFIKLPLLLHVPIVFIAAVSVGAIWGALAGFMKARYGVHEVIGTIMLNWIALYFNNFIISQPGIQRPQSEATYKILNTARIDILGVWKVTKEGIAFRKTHPFWGDILKSPLNLGILIAIAAAVIVWFILNKTTLGFELRAVGFNKDAAEYGGIRVNRSMVISMAIAGGLAGLAGAVQVSGVSREVFKLAAMEGYGFDGIAVSLIGNSTPIGCVFSGLLFGALKYGGGKIQSAMRAPTEIINIVIGTIVYFIAMPRLITMILSQKRKKGDK